MQKLYPSFHSLEVFMPVVKNEPFYYSLLEDMQSIPFYKGLETSVFFQPEIRKKVYQLVVRNGYQLTVWLTPSINEHNLNLASLDTDVRKRSVSFARKLINFAAEMGATHCSVPSGPYLGQDTLEESKKVLFDSYVALYENVKQFETVDLTLEPMDRFASKKMILGPIAEVIQWFTELRKTCSKFFIHWDSSHETLGNIDLHKSLELAKPYLAQIHLCNCINNPSHPCFGDWHMDVGHAPDWKTWGYLNPTIGGSLLQQIASYEKISGVDRTFCSVEVRSHMGDDLWGKEKQVRDFLQECFRCAGLAFDS